MSVSNTINRSKVFHWVKKLGAAGFLFFLIKGLLWLLVPAIIAYYTAK